MSEADYIVLNQDGDYWTGLGWDSEPDQAKDLCIKEAAKLAVDYAPTEILLGDGDILGVAYGVESGILYVWLEYPDGSSRRYDDNEAAIKAICELGR